MLNRRRSKQPAALSVQRPYCPKLEMLEDRSLLTAGALDPTFGTSGIANMETSDTRYMHDYITAIASQPDGKVLVSGHTQYDPNAPPVDDLLLMRYNQNGSLDTGFGVGGTVRTKLGAFSA